MLRPGVISFHVLVNNMANIKKWALLYDELWVQGISKVSPDPSHDQEAFASISWLAGQGFVKEPPIALESGDLKTDAVVKAFNKLYRDADASLDKSYRTRELAARNAAAAIWNMDMALTRLIAYVMWRDRQEMVFPVAFPFVDELARGSSISKSQQVLQIVLKRFPIPRADLPLEDILAFRRDQETKYKFDKLWHWMQKVAMGNTDPKEIEEELDWLLTDYRFQIQQISKTVRTDRLKAWLTVPANVLENLVHLKFGRATALLLDVKSASIAAHREELKTPGNEIAYLNESIELLSPRRSSSDT